MISNFIHENYYNYNIKISYEKNILDTGGGVKNAMKLFDDENIIVTNADIFFKRENEIDVSNLINNFNSKEECRLLLVEKEKAHGLINKGGDFSLNNNYVIMYYLIIIII